MVSPSIERVSAVGGGCAALVLASLLAAGSAAATEWPMYAGGPHRLFFNPAETRITAGNVAGLHVKWAFPTGAIVTASPAVVTLDLPGEGATPVAFIASWDNNLYALRVRDGTALWHFSMVDQPGASSRSPLHNEIGAGSQ